MSRVCLLLVFVIIAIACAGCTGPGTGGGGGNVTAAIPRETPYWEMKQPGVEVAIQESQRTVSEVASMLASGNTTGRLMPSLPNALEDEIGAAPAITRERTVMITAALQNATVVEAHPSIVYYRTRYAGSDYTFYTLLEGEQWVVYGF